MQCVLSSTELALQVKEIILKQNSNTLIEVDGGVTIHNAKKLIENGATH